MRRLRLPGPNAAPRPNAAPNAKIDPAIGITIRLREEPESGPLPGRPSLLCIHGAGMSSVVWMDMVRRLAPAHHVLAPDLPGHGQSEPWPGAAPSSGSAQQRGPLQPRPYGAEGKAPSIDGYRDALAAILTAARRPAVAGQPVVLLGHSMGAAIALRYALSFPEQVAGLVLFNGAARMRVSAELLQMLARDLPGPLPKNGNGNGNDNDNGNDNPFADRMPDALADLSFSPATLPDLRARWQAVLTCAPRQTVIDDFRACDGFDVRAELPRLRVPTLVVAGADDLLVPPRLSQECAGLIPAGRLLIVPATGHLSHLEQPEQVHAVLDPFLSSLNGV